MSGLEMAWGLSLLITLTALPVGMVRLLAYRSGEIDHTRTLLVAAVVAMSIGVLAALVLAVTSLLLMVR
ncbi:MAG TPA: hypothetical protein VLA97_12310 [Nocardioidaceae bacterium]|nr:hypothetical protein [Nocardioidaceae bacterium]